LCSTFARFTGIGSRERHVWTVATKIGETHAKLWICFRKIPYPLEIAACRTYVNGKTKLMV